MLESNYAIEINLPIDKVMQLFQNQDYFKEWQDGLISFENTSNQVGELKSTRRMKISMVGTSITMNEEITKIDLPRIWEATYRTKGVINYQSNRFRESETTTNNVTKKVTHWESNSIFKFTGMMRLIASTRPQLFTGQTYEYMKSFKAFAESITKKEIH
jgi:carbon monoxide dehydrogenase subunit G